MLRSLRFSTEGSPRRLWLPLLAVVGLGLAAESSLYRWVDTGNWVPDLVTGATLAGCGLIARYRRRDRTCGLLLLASGVAWFFPDFATVGAGGVRWLATHSLYWYHSPLLQLALTYPLGRPRSRAELASVAVGYGLSLVLVVWRSELATIGSAVGMVGLAGVPYLLAVGRERVMRRYAVAATTCLAVVLAVTAVARAAGVADAAATLHGFEAALCVLALGLLAGLVVAPWDRADVSDLVVEIGGGGSGSLRDQLAGVLGDPSLEIGYWRPETRGYVDAVGAPLAPPREDGRRATTILEWGGEPVAILVHDPAVLDDPTLVEAVGTAARLGSANARMQADVVTQLHEIAASRQRIVEAEANARSQLERRLRSGPLARLDQLASTLEAARSSTLQATTLDPIARAEDRLARTSAELKRLAQGIRPAGPGAMELVSALDTLVAESRLPVVMSISPIEASASVNACVYFVCSEALANVAKSARARRVTIAVTAEPDTLRAMIEDDGVGGADLAAGTGLQGLADRVQSLGGRLEIDSPVGHGTRVIAIIPLTSPAEERSAVPAVSRP